MPLLRALRFDSIGHDSARLDGLILDTVDAAGMPTDSVLWLRNGGGKSSILSLAFNVVRPGQRHFMGKEQDARSRQLADYVAEDDTGTATLEWQLENGDTLLTACTLEHARRGQARELRCLYWSVRVPLVARANWNVRSLPLWEHVDGARRFRRITALKEYLRAADGKDGVSVVIEERQAEWARHLAAFGLDHEVFGYQVEMNRREGGADELFRFKTTGEFVDFILEVVVEPEHPSLVCGNIERHKEKVKQRPELVAQVAALEKVLEHLRPLQLLAERRVAVLQEMEAAAAALHGHEVCMGATAVFQHARHAAETAEAERHREAANQAQQRRIHANWAARVFRYRRARLHAVAAGARDADAARALADAETLVRRADALVPLQLLDTETERATTVRVALGKLHEQNRPLLEELHARATVFLRVLEREAEGIRAQLDATERRLVELDRERTAAGAQRDRLLKEQATRVARLEAEQARYRRLESERARLEDSGVVAAGELLADAAVRVEAQRNHEEQRLRELAEEAERHAGVKAAAYAEQVQSTSEAERHAKEVAAIASNTRRAREAWSRIAEHRVFMDVLEVNAPALPEGAADLARRLREEVGKRRDRQLVLREEQAHDARTQTALEANGLMPPSLASEQAFRALRDQGIHAHHGTKYLVDNGAVHVEERIRAHPELAAGLVVPVAELARIRVDPLQRTLRLDVPIVVGTTKDILDECAGESDALVLLPGQAAYDRRAATVELERLKADAARRARELEHLARDESACAALAADLEATLRSLPPEWFELREAERRGAEHMEVQAREVAAAALARREKAAVQEVATRAAMDACTTRRRDAERHGDMVAALIRDGGADMPSLLQALGDQEVQLASVNADLRSCDEGLVRIAHDLEAARERRHAGQLLLQPLQREADAVRPYASAEAGDGWPPLEHARHAYELARNRYERTVADDALHGQLAEIERSVARLTADVERLCRQAGITVVELRALLREATTEGGVEALRDDAAARREHAQREKTAATQAAAAAAAALVEPEKSYRDLAADKRAEVERYDRECATWTAEELDVQIEQRDAAGLQASQEVTTSEDARKLALDRAEHAARLAAKAEAVRNTAALALDNASSSELVRAIRQRPLEPLPSEDPGAVQADVDALARRLSDSRNALEAADREAQARSADLVRLVSAGARQRLPAELSERLETRDLGELLMRAGGLVADVELYVTATRKDLEQVDRDRGLLAEELLAVADPAVKMLEGLERSSLFPEHVETWGGLPFIRARVRKPDAPQERLALMANLVDALVRDERVPTPLVLVQRAVRDLAAAGIRLEIIKPEVHRRLAYVPVEHMASFSGGERLTAAILLFCTLVRLRFRKRGASVSGGQVLFLDNPIGTCSRRELVALQRSMAAAHDVQLVYTTGVEDLEALGELPNRVRIRNESRDVRGRLHATLDAREATPLQAVRVVKREDADVP